MIEIPRIAVHEVNLRLAEGIHRQIPEFDPEFLATHYDAEGIDQKSPHFLAAAHNGVGAGYAISYDRNVGMPEASFHLWLAGVAPEKRQFGVFGALIEAVEAEALRRNHRRVTVTSFRESFPTMVHTLSTRHGFSIISEEAQIKDGKQSTKVRFCKELNPAHE